MTARRQAAGSHIGALRRNPNFARLWVGEVLSDVGSQATTIAMPLLVLALTGSPAKAGLVGVARTVAFPLVALPSGVLADRVDRRRVMIACVLGRMLAGASIVIALAVGRPPFGQLLVVSLIDAALFSAAFTAERGLITQLVPREALADAVTLNEGRSAAAFVAGPPAGGVLFGIARGLPFVADVGSFAIALLALAGIRPPERAVPPGSTAGGAMAGGSAAGGVRAVPGLVHEGIRWLWQQPFLRAGSVLYATLNLTIQAAELLALLIARHHGASSAGVGVAFAIIGAGGISGAAIAGPLRRRLSGRWAVLAEPWVDAVLLPLLLVAHSPVAIGLVVGATFVPMTLSSSVVVGRRLALTPDPLRGRVQASANFMGSSISWLGPLAVGLLFQYAGERAAVLVVSGWALAIAAAATLAPALRSVPDVPEVAAD